MSERLREALRDACRYMDSLSYDANIGLPAEFLEWERLAAEEPTPSGEEARLFGLLELIENIACIGTPDEIRAVTKERFAQKGPTP